MINTITCKFKECVKTNNVNRLQEESVFIVLRIIKRMTRTSITLKLKVNKNFNRSLMNLYIIMLIE